MRDGVFYTHPSIDTKQKGRISEMQKNKIEFITINQMLEYAVIKYPELNLYISKKMCGDANCPDRRNSLKKYIRKTLSDYKLIWRDTFEKKQGNVSEIEEEDSEKSSELGSKTEPYKIAKEIAYFVIDNILADYFQQRIDEYKNQHEEETKENNKKQNLQLNKEQQILFQAGTYEQIQEAYGNNVDFDDDLMDGCIKENFENIECNGIHEWIHKNNLEYHLPVKPWSKEYETDAEGLPSGFADEVIEKMMLRTLFSHFYEFDEFRFRKDLILRAKHIVPTDPVRFEEGYSELTEMLEKPLGYYVFPKDKQEKEQAEDEMKRTSNIYENVLNIIVDILAKNEIIDGYKLQEHEADKLLKETKKCIDKQCSELFRTPYEVSKLKLFEKNK